MLLSRRQLPWIDEPRPRVSHGEPLARRGRAVVAAVDIGDPDHTELNRRIVRVAGGIADAAGATLHLLHVWRIFGESTLSAPVRGIGARDLHALRRVMRGELLERMAELTREVPYGQPKVSVLRGATGRTIRRVARRVRADVVVMGAVRGPRIGGLMFSGVSEAVAGGDQYSVVLVGRRPGQSGGMTSA